MIKSGLILKADSLNLFLKKIVLIFFYFEIEIKNQNKTEIVFLKNTDLPGQFYGNYFSCQT